MENIEELKSYLNRQLDERQSRLVDYDKLVELKSQIEEQLSKFGDVTPIKNEIAEIEHLISGLEPKEEVSNENI